MAGDGAYAIRYDAGVAEDRDAVERHAVVGDPGASVIADADEAVASADESVGVAASRRAIAENSISPLACCGRGPRRLDQRFGFAVEASLRSASRTVEAGPVFRPVDRHGRVGSERLSGEAVSLIVKERVAAVGIEPTGFSGHSLRAGFATSAVQGGVSTLKIRAQTGHASDAMLGRYIRDGELFVDNAAGALL